MKRLVFPAVVLSLTAQTAEAGVFEFKSFSFANFGTPFLLVENTTNDLESALNGGAFRFGDGVATLADLLQEGPTSWSQEYDVGGGLHVAFAAEAVYRPAEPLSTAAPGIGGKVSASNNQYPGTSTVIGESYVYLKHTVSINNPTTRDEYLKSYGVTTSLDGVIHGSGDAFVQVGQATLLTLDDGSRYIDSDMETFVGPIFKIAEPFNTFYFGRPGLFAQPPLTLTSSGPYGVNLIAHSSHSMTIETLLYVRAQTGGQERGAGTASADFSNTMRVSNIQFFDENDQVIPGLEVVGFNGDVYPYNVVPEPCTLTLVSIGCIGWLFARLRGTQRL